MSGIGGTGPSITSEFLMKFGELADNKTGNKDGKVDKKEVEALINELRELQGKDWGELTSEQQTRLLELQQGLKDVSLSDDGTISSGEILFGDAISRAGKEDLDKLLQAVIDAQNFCVTDSVLDLIRKQGIKIDDNVVEKLKWKTFSNKEDFEKTLKELIPDLKKKLKPDQLDQLILLMMQHVERYYVEGTRLGAVEITSVKKLESKKPTTDSGLAAGDARAEAKMAAIELVQQADKLLTIFNGNPPSPIKEMIEFIKKEGVDNLSASELRNLWDNFYCNPNFDTVYEGLTIDQKKEVDTFINKLDYADITQWEYEINYVEGDLRENAQSDITEFKKQIDNLISEFSPPKCTTEPPEEIKTLLSLLSSIKEKGLDEITDDDMSKIKTEIEKLEDFSSVLFTDDVSIDQFIAFYDLSDSLRKVEVSISDYKLYKADIQRLNEISSPTSITGLFESEEIDLKNDADAAVKDFVTEGKKILEKILDPNYTGPGKETAKLILDKINQKGENLNMNDLNDIFNIYYEDSSITFDKNGNLPTEWQDFMDKFYKVDNAIWDYESNTNKIYNKEELSSDKEKDLLDDAKAKLNILTTDGLKILEKQYPDPTTRPPEIQKIIEILKKGGDNLTMKDLDTIFYSGLDFEDTGNFIPDYFWNLFDDADWATWTYENKTGKKLEATSSGEVSQEVSIVGPEQDKTKLEDFNSSIFSSVLLENIETLRKAGVDVSALEGTIEALKDPTKVTENLPKIKEFLDKLDINKLPNQIRDKLTIFKNLVDTAFISNEKLIKELSTAADKLENLIKKLKESGKADHAVIAELEEKLKSLKTAITQLSPPQNIRFSSLDPKIQSDTLILFIDGGMLNQIYESHKRKRNGGEQVALKEVLRYIHDVKEMKVAEATENDGTPSAKAGSKTSRLSLDESASAIIGEVSRNSAEFEDKPDNFIDLYRKLASNKHLSKEDRERLFNIFKKLPAQLLPRFLEDVGDLNKYEKYSQELANVARSIISKYSFLLKLQDVPQEQIKSILGRITDPKNTDQINSVISELINLTKDKKEVVESSVGALFIGSMTRTIENIGVKPEVLEKTVENLDYFVSDVLSGLDIGSIMDFMNATSGGLDALSTRETAFNDVNNYMNEPDNQADILAMMNAYVNATLGEIAKEEIALADEMEALLDLSPVPDLSQFECGDPMIDLFKQFARILVEVSTNINKMVAEKMLAYLLDEKIREKYAENMKKMLEEHFSKLDSMVQAFKEKLEDFLKQDTEYSKQLNRLINGLENTIKNVKNDAKEILKSLENMDKLTEQFKNGKIDEKTYHNEMKNETLNILTHQNNMIKNLENFYDNLSQTANILVDINKEKLSTAVA